MVWRLRVDKGSSGGADGGVAGSSGLRPPPKPPEDADALGVAMFYLDYWLSEFPRARRVVKKRAAAVIVWTAIMNGLIGVTGVVVAVTGRSWVAIISTALAGVIGVLAAWEGLFRHRELWVQRSLVLSQLQALQRAGLLRKALKESPDELAQEIMAGLDAVLGDDVAAWTALRHSASSTQNNPPKSSNTESSD